MNLLKKTFMIMIILTLIIGTSCKKKDKTDSNDEKQSEKVDKYEALYGTYMTITSGMERYGWDLPSDVVDESIYPDTYLGYRVNKTIILEDRELDSYAYLFKTDLSGTYIYTKDDLNDSVGIFTTIDGITYFGPEENPTLVLVDGTVENEELFILDTTKIICSNALHSETLQKIKISQNVISIGEGAFAGCSMVTEINIPASVMYIGAAILSNKYAKIICEGIVWQRGWNKNWNKTGLHTCLWKDHLYEYDEETQNYYAGTYTHVSYIDTTWADSISDEENIIYGMTYKYHFDKNENYFEAVFFNNANWKGDIFIIQSSFLHTPVTIIDLDLSSTARNIKLEEGIKKVICLYAIYSELAPFDKLNSSSYYYNIELPSTIEYLNDCVLTENFNIYVAENLTSNLKYLGSNNFTLFNFIKQEFTGAVGLSRFIVSIYENGYYVGSTKNPYLIYLFPVSSCSTVTLHADTEYVMGEGTGAICDDNCLMNRNDEHLGNVEIVWNNNVKYIGLGYTATLSSDARKKFVLPDTAQYVFYDDYSLDLYTEYENGYYLGTISNPYYAFMRMIDPTKELVINENTQIIAENAFFYAPYLLSDETKTPLELIAEYCEMHGHGFSTTLKYSYDYCSFNSNDEGFIIDEKTTNMLKEKYGYYPAAANYCLPISACTVYEDSYLNHNSSNNLFKDAVNNSNLFYFHLFDDKISDIFEYIYVMYCQGLYLNEKCEKLKQEGDIENFIVNWITQNPFYYCDGESIKKDISE